MQTLIVVDKPSDWPLDLPDVLVVSARDYLSQPLFRDMPRAKVFNLCKCYKYQSTGYYVSLLAEARGHDPLPSVSTMQDMKSQAVIRLASGDLQRQIEKDLAPIRSDSFVLSVYFGRNLAKRYDRLAGQLFEYFKAPFLRAYFVWHQGTGANNAQGGNWALVNVGPIAAAAVPEEHRLFAIKAATDYLAGRKQTVSRRSEKRFDLAILYGGDETPPSNERAIEKFIKAADRRGMHAEVIRKEDFKHLPEFDGLWIRETTSVNHHTYKFAQRGEAEGLVVIDDPESIVRCTNKVYLTELMEHQRIRIPRTLILSRANLSHVARDLGFPCILKQPDSSFSQGVLKVVDEGMLRIVADTLFEKSELLLAQEYIPTSYDWRIGIIDRKPVYACKYHMAHKHWQITKKTRGGKFLGGRVESFALGTVPEEVLTTALRAANAIGNGLYGVDLKEHNDLAYVMEVNDNPNIDAGYEDGILKDELYDIIADVFSTRIESRKQRKTA